MTERSEPVAPRPAVALIRIARWQRRYPLVQVFALAAVHLYCLATLDGFGSWQSLYSMLVLAVLLGIAACGQTVVLLIGGIDFSIPAFIIAGATLTVQVRDLPFPAVLAFLVVGSLVTGGLSGYLAHRFQVQPLIITLGVGSIVTGGVLVYAQGLVTGTAPGWLSRLTSPVGQTFGVPVPPLVIIWTALAVAVGIVLGHTVIGRWIYATGANPRAAELALVPTRRVWTGAFAFSGLTAVLTGVLLAGFSGSGDSTIGDPYLWQSLTAVVVGGTLFGARGDYWRTVTGTLIVTELTTLLIGSGATPADQQILSGLLILGVVALYGRERRLRDRL